LRGTIGALLRLVEAGLTQGTPAGVKEARETLLEARRLYGIVATVRQKERAEMKLER